MKKKSLLPALVLLILLTGCTGEKDNNKKIRIAEQFGLAYAPLQIIKEKGFIEESDSGIAVEWIRLGNTAAIREAVLAGDLDAGFMGIPPFLIARDKGMEWKIATGLSRSPLGLVVPAGKYDSLSDFKADDKIALPQPGSIQHILLTMACDREEGDASFLDRNLLSLKHPDGMNALLSGSVQGHFTSPPYIFYEEDQPGFEVLLTGDEAIGQPFTFIVGVVTEQFREQNYELYEAFLKAVEKAVRFLDENREESVEILAEAYSMERSEVEDFLYRPGMVFETEVKGLESFISFMGKNGYLENEMDARSVLF